MAVSHISAITLAVTDMGRSVDFYQKLGLTLYYGEKDSVFVSLRAGADTINLILDADRANVWWGRVILRVDSTDAVYKLLLGKGLNPEEPQDAIWGERFFHIRDPDGHEISFAESLTKDTLC